MIDRVTIKPIRTRLFREGEALENFLLAFVPRRLPEGALIAVTSKVIALSEGRVVSIASTDEKEQVILRESDETRRTPWCLLTRRNGEWYANAGADESNARGKLILLPRDSHASARRIWHWAKRTYRRKNLGVIVTDTRLYPMRVGTMGVALGWAGFAPIVNYIGKPDLFGRELRHTQANVANALAVAAVLVMGEGSERTPVAVITDAPVVFCSRWPKPERLAIDPREDVYRAAYVRSPQEPRSNRPSRGS